MKNMQLIKRILEIKCQVETLLNSDFAKYIESTGRVLRKQQELIHMLQNKLDSQASELKRQQLSEKIRVVRCKDCEHRIYDNSRNLYYCRVYHGLGDVSDMNYCCFGENKIEAENE